MEKYQIKLINTVTASTINIPLVMQYQFAGQSELIDRVFVDTETQNAINPIIDYDKTRYIPLDLNNNQIDKISYIINLTGATTYDSIGFTDDDIKFQKSNFKQTFLRLSYYDTDNPMTQRLITSQTIFSRLTPNDLLPFNTTLGLPGQPKPANQIPLVFTLENNLFNPRGFLEGYYLYDYKDILNVGDFRYLYMKASFNNAKDGLSTNLMVKSTPQSIDKLIRETYTRYKLFRTQTGYYYQIDNTYQGNGPATTNNVSYTQNPSQVTINLYKIAAL
jgi:hypothetical protein